MDRLYFHRIPGGCREADRKCRLSENVLRSDAGIHAGTGRGGELR